MTDIIHALSRAQRATIRYGVSPSCEQCPYHPSIHLSPVAARGAPSVRASKSESPHSPDSNWNRRAQPSATPPPQVPAFSPASTCAPITGSTLKLPLTTTPTPPTGPANSSPIGVPVPTAPRSHSSKFGRDVSKTTPNKWHNLEPTKVVAKAVLPGLDTGKVTIASTAKPAESFLSWPSETEGELGTSERCRVPDFARLSQGQGRNFSAAAHGWKTWKT
jgi:hypothetical protein